MTIETLLSRLQKVRKRGHNQWMACCPVHQERTPSLSIKDDDGKIIMHCFGCGAKGPEIIESVGMEISDLFPPSDNYDPAIKQKRQFHDACQILEGLAFESLVVLITSRDMISSKTISTEDQERLSVAVLRIHAATEYTKRIMR